MKVQPHHSFVKIKDMKEYLPIVLVFEYRTLVSVEYYHKLPAFVSLQFGYDNDGQGVAFVDDNHITNAITEDEYHDALTSEQIDNDILRNAL